MGMPSRAGPVAILGLRAAMLDAAIVGPLMARKSVVVWSLGVSEAQLASGSCWSSSVSSRCAGSSRSWIL